MLDVGGAATLNETFRSLRMGGYVALVGMLGGTKLEVDVMSLFRSFVHLRGIGVGSRASFLDLLHAMEVKQIRPVVDREFPFSDAREAFRHLQTGTHFGKIIIVHPAP